MLTRLGGGLWYIAAGIADHVWTVPELLGVA